MRDLILTILLSLIKLMVMSAGLLLSALIGAAFVLTYMWDVVFGGSRSARPAG